DRRRERLSAGEEAPRRAARPGGHGRRRAGSGRDRERASGGRPRGPRRPRARAAGGGVPSDQRAPARGHDRLAEVGACGVRARPRRGDVEGQARDRWLRRRSGAADHPQRDGLHGLHGRGRGVPDPPPPQQSRADPPDGRGRPRARAAVVSHHAPPHGLPGAHDPPRAITARGLGLLEADVTSAADEWLERLLRPVLEQKADLVVPVYARHRYDGTITNLVLAPLVRALFGRRLHQPLAGARALSAGLLDRLLADPRWPAPGTNQTDLWVEGTAIAEGFAVWEAWLGHRRATSRTLTPDLPTMVVQAVGGLFAVMGGYDDLWLDIRGSEPVPTAGAPAPSSVEPVALDVDRMVGAFRRGLRDLGTIWEHILAPETLGDVLSLDAGSAARFRFPDELWARVAYDFALGHHYNVVYREHLLRSFVPLYLGRTAAFVVATRDRDVGAAETHLDGVGEAFERHKRYLVERWR